MRGADASRGNAIPFRSPPARGQAPEDLLERATFVDGEQPRHVFEEQQRRVTVDDDAPDGRPEPSLVVGSAALAGDRGRLTGEARSNEIHASAPCLAVEGVEIVPDRSRSHRRFFHPGHESGCNVGLPLDNAHNATVDAGSGEGSTCGVLEAEEAAAEGEGTKLKASCETGVAGAGVEAGIGGT